MLRYVLCLLTVFVLTDGLSAQGFPAETLVCRAGAFVLDSPLDDSVVYHYR